VVIPTDLLAEADRIAGERGEDRAVVLGDLAAQALPEALADAAADRLAPHTTTPRGSYPEAPTHSLSNVKVAFSLPPGDPEREAGSASAGP
jgi:hypothetical protein